MAFPPAPIKLLKHVTTLLNGGLIKQKPIWYPVLQLIPPGPSIIRTPNPEPNLAGHTPEELLLEQSRLPTRPTSLRHQQKHLRTRPPRPRKIVYPEDRLRRQFYRDHPFELQRPVDLNLNEKGVTGETVIQHQLYLMINKGMTEREAYVRATTNFYEIREQEEANERAVREAIAEKLGPEYTKIETLRAIEKEERALKAGEILL